MNYAAIKKAVRKESEPLHCLFAERTLLTFHKRMPAKQEGDAPQARESYYGIDDTAEERTLAPKKPCHKIKLENAHKAPVQTADYGQNHRYGIHFSTSVSSFGCH